MMAQESPTTYLVNLRNHGTVIQVSDFISVFSTGVHAMTSTFRRSRIIRQVFGNTANVVKSNRRERMRCQPRVVRLEDRVNPVAVANVLVNNPLADTTIRDTQSETSTIVFGNITAALTRRLGGRTIAPRSSFVVTQSPKNLRWWRCIERTGATAITT